MRSAHPGRLWSVILACLLFSSIPAQDESRKERAGAALVADEPALRALAQEFYAAYTKKDLDGFLRLWSARAPDLEARRQEMRKLFADHEKIEVKSLAIRKVTIDGEKAKLRVDVEMSAVETQTGKPASGFGPMKRAMRYVKEESAWRVWYERSAEEDLAVTLVEAKTENERNALLSVEKDLKTKDLPYALVRQGNRLRRQGVVPQALSILSLAQTIARQIGDKSEIARALSAIGVVHAMQSDYSVALQHFQESLTLREALGDAAGIAGALNNIGNVQREQGNYDQALDAFQKSLTLSEASGDEAETARASGNLANIHSSQGDYARALAYYQKSLILFEALDSKAEIARTLTNIGIVYSLQGDSAQALAYYQKSMPVYESVGDKVGIAMALDNIGDTHWERGKYIQALDYYLKSATMSEAFGYKELNAYTLSHIGRAYTSQGDYVKGLEYCQKGLTALESLGDKAGIAYALSNIANIHFAQSNYTQALEYYQKCLAISEVLGIKIMIAEALTSAGRSYRALNQLTQSRRAFEEAINTIETLRAQVAGAEKEQQSFFETKLAPYQGMVELLAAQNQSDAALAYAERAKARALLDALQSGRINVTKAMTAAEKERERGFNNQLVSLNTQISRENLRPQPDAARLNDLNTQLQKARLDYEAFQTGLYAAHPELKVQRGEAQPLTLEQARDLLPDARGALLEYVVTNEKTYLFALTGNAAGKTVDLKVYPLEIKSKELSARAAKFRETLAKGSPGFRQPARELYNLLLKPAAAQLQGKTSLVIVPDGALWELPFQALLTASNRYLLEDCAIAYAPSLTALREMTRLRDGKKDSTNYPTLLAFGNPALGNQTITRAKSVLMDEKLDPLPEAERQVNTLKQIYGATKSKVYTGAEAREERAKAEAGGYRILHLATHGILNDSSPMYSRVLLSQADGDANEDGLLEAWEIMKMDLKADLAVLSACETARGRVGAGEGMIGLSWALFVAGCPTTVVSQWKVESTSTTELMVEFHRQLKSQMASPSGYFSAARALREAALKLQRMSAYRHPFYWAGFVVAGKGF